MTYGEYRKNKLIDADSFRTQGMCQEYLIEETNETGEYAGSCEQQGSGK